MDDVPVSDAAPERLRGEEGIIHCNITSARSRAMAVLFSLEPTASALSKASESHSAWVMVYYLIWMKHQAETAPFQKHNS